MSYNIWTLTIEQLRDLIASGNDSHANQIRIKENGDIFISSITGAELIDGIIGRFETFDAHNGYIGPMAAANPDYVQRMFDAIQAWKKNPVVTLTFGNKLTFVSFP